MSDVPQPSSNANSAKRVTTVHVGDRRCPSEVHTMRCVFHDFKGLQHATDSERMRIHGHLWTLGLKPGVDEDEDEESSEKPIKLYLYTWPDDDHDEVLASFKFRIPGVPGSEKGRNKRNLSLYIGVGFHDFLPRKDVLDPDKNYLKDGALTVEVDIQVWREDPKLWSTPVVHSAFQNDMVHAFETAKFADVTFVVQGKKFPVHRVVMALRAPVLAAFFDDEPPNSEIELRNDSIDATMFELLLRFVYGSGLPPLDDLRGQACELLHAANFCGLTTPKLAAESILIESVAADTAAEMLTLADASSCALLKEVAIEFFVANPAAVRASSAWANVKESNALMDELLEAMYAGKTDPSEEVDVDRMSVATLRRKLGEIGLDVDGSRASLIKRLKEE